MEIKFKRGKLYRMRGPGMDYLPGQYALIDDPKGSSVRFIWVMEDSKTGNLVAGYEYLMGNKMDNSHIMDKRIFIPTSYDCEKLRLSSPNYDIEYCPMPPHNPRWQKQIYATDEMEFEVITFELDGLQYHPGDEVPDHWARKRRDD